MLGSQASAQLAETTIGNFRKVSQCTERLWPDFTWKDLQILVVDPAQESLPILDGTTGEVTRLPSKDFQHQAELRAAFSFFTEKGKQWMSVNTDFGAHLRDSLQFFGFGVHESFHRLAQKNWVIKDGGRGTLLPVRWEPRYFRAMLENNLRDFLKSGDVQSLRHAAYWYRQWTQKAPSEVQSTTDGYEGTAHYVEILSMGLAEFGCQITEDSLKEKVLQEVAASWSLLQVKGGMSLDAEGYALGGLAGWILRWKKRVPDWQKRVAQGETPLDVLLGSVTPLFEDTDAAVAEDFKETATSKQDEADMALGETYKNLDSVDLVMLSFPANWKPGATSFKGFFLDPSKDYWFGVLAEELEFRNGSSLVRTEKGLSLVQTAHRSPCEPTQWNFALTKKDFQALDAGHFQIRSSKVNGTLKGVSRQGSDGALWFCAQD